MPLDEKPISELLEQALALGRKAVPDAAISIDIVSERDGNTRFARNEITSTGEVDETRLTIEVAFEQRHAAVSINQTGGDALQAAIAQAARLARLAPEDPERMPVLGAQIYASAPAALDPGAAALGAETRAAAASAAIERAGKDGLTVAGFFEHSAGVHAFGTSAGLRAVHASTAVSFSCTARTADAAGSGWAGLASHRASDVDTAKIVAAACAKATRSARAQKLLPGRYTVVLEPAAVAGLVSSVTGSLGARAAGEGRSFFARAGGGTRIGEPVAAKGMTLASNPFDPRTPGAPFDAEGLPAVARNWIDGGRLTGLVYSRYWARKQGQTPTGQPEGWELRGGRASRDELVRGVKRGVLITRFWYIRGVDPQAMLLTGLTRDGVFAIEDGEIARPVNNFRFNESPMVMLANAEAWSRDTECPASRSLRVPAIRSHDFNLASISDAV